jgi:tetratricopeptide (TPR) repeat protein
MRSFAIPAIVVAALIGPPALSYGQGSESAPETLSPAPTPAPAPESKAPAEADLDTLFSELKNAPNADAAKAAEAAILRRFLTSGSDTVDLLMTWAIDSMNKEDYPLALDILDNIVTIKPDYAEGWNKRATVYYLADEYAKSLADIRRVLSLQPKHFGALSGLGMIMRELGEKEKAITAFREALAVDPYLESVKKALEELEKENAGQAI